jgi:type I restriction enzyme S subunit
MTANDFFEHFPALADAPGGIPKLRELILQSALQGKLVSQDASDEPASALLERITFEKKRSANGKSRKPHVMDDASLSGPWPLPTSWAWASLDEIGWLNPRNDIPDETEVSFIPMALIPAEYGRAATFEKRRWDEIKSGFTHFAEDDVVVAKITPCFQNGKSCVMRGLLNRVGAGTTELHVFRVVNQTIDPDYVLVFLKSSHFLDNGVSQMTGSAGQKRVPIYYFASCPFPLPPLAEQKRIVTKVDRLMALCDALEAQQQARHAVRSRLHATLLGNLQTAANAADFARAWQRLRDHFAELFTPGEAALDAVAQLRQTILQLAVQGKLVPQDAADEPAERFLMQPVERELGQGEQLPRGWITTHVSSAFDVVGGITKNPSRSPVKNYFPYLRVANVQRGKLNLSEMESFELVNGELQRWRLESGDLLIVEGNGSEHEIGRCAIWKDEIENCVHQNHIIRCRPHRRDVSPFVLLYLNSPSGREKMKRMAITTSGLFSLSVGKIRSLLIPLAPLAEQQRIVAKVQQLMAQCDALEASLKAAATVSERWSAAAVRRLLGGPAR